MLTELIIAGPPGDADANTPKSNLAISRVSAELKITKIENGGASIKVGVPPVDLGLDGSRTKTNDSTITFEFTPYGVSQAGWQANKLPTGTDLIPPPGRVAPASGTLPKFQIDPKLLQQTFPDAPSPEKKP